ncbi:uncharacterized protein [Panulirus ornatus]|uniref:uncharacterized protein isoform X4 n=1 Tax=Panulirus ornatus TaxID=150431 RepID=UPI003A84F645
MIGDVLDWDAGLQLLCLLSNVMGIRQSKGPAAAPGLAGPLGNLEQKAEGQRGTPVITQENTSSISPPSSPGSLPSEASSNSLNRECDTTSATEDPSFASCLTEGPSSVSEIVSVSPVKDSAPAAFVRKSSGGEAHPQAFPINSDSEYESAEEVDLPPDPDFITKDHSFSTSLVSPSLVTDEAKGTEQEVRTSHDVKEQSSTPVHKEKTYTGTKPSPVGVDNLVVSSESTVVAVDKESDELNFGHPENLRSTICESVVTVTKSEIIEESVSKKAVLVDQQVTESKVERDTNEDIESDVITQTSGNVVTLENRTLDSTIPSDLIPESGNCKHFPTEPLVDLRESDVKENEILLGSQQETELSKFKETEIHSELKPDSEIFNQVNKSEVFHIVSETSKSEGADNLEHVEVAKEFPRDQAENQQDKCLKENHTEQPALKEEFNPTTAVFDTPPEEPRPLPESFIDPNDIPITPKKSYNLDFLDRLDDPNFNPFATKTVVRSTPPPSPEPGCKLPPLKPTVRKKKVKEDTKTSSETTENTETKVQVLDVGKNLTEREGQQGEHQESLSPDRDRGLLTENRSVDGCSVDDGEIHPEKIEQSEKSQNLLEITFEDAGTPVCKPPRKLGKKPQLKQQRQSVTKTPPKSKIIERNNNRVKEIKSEPEELPIPQSKGYDLDFLDNLEDPNFNPFVTKCSVRNSPPKEGFTLADDKEEDRHKVKVIPAKKEPTKKGFAVIKDKAQIKEPEVSETDSSKNTVDITVDSELNSGVNQLEDKPIEPTEEELPSPKQGYNLDFLDDPDFDPFQSRSTLKKNIQGSETSNSDEVPKDIGVKDNTVIREKEFHIECGQDNVTVPEKEIEISKQEPQTQKEESDRKESIQPDTEVDKEEPEVVEEKTQPVKESDQVSFEKIHGCEERLKVSDNELKASEEKFESVAEYSQNDENSHISEEVNQEVEDLKLESLSKVDLETEESAVRKSKSTSDARNEINLPKVPSIGTIGQLDSLEFAQLLGNEASRLAEEFMNCSTDSGLPDSDDSSHIRSGSLNSTMADTSYTKSPQYGAHLDESVNPFQKHSRISRSPPLGKRGVVCGAESGDDAHVHDPYKARRSQKRESVMGEERSDTVSLDDDSGIVLGSHLETEVNHSEAGPEIATGLTSSDLRCASQLRTEEQEEEFCDQITDEEFLASEAFFKQASDMENQLRKSLASPLMGSHSKLSGDEVTPTKEKKEPHAIKEPSVITPESPQNKPVPSTSSPAPPREERSAPEGTSSPTPRPSDTSEHKTSSSRPASVPPEGYMTAAEVQELIKRQELKFEEKLLQAELAAGEKEKKLRQAMKDEQKERNHLGESVAELTQSRDALLKMVGQYKDMLASLVSEKEKEKQAAEERIKTIEQERNQALEDLANVEVAFSDVHRKYERTKQVVDTLRRNEETLRGAVADYESKLQKQEQKFIEFQKHAEEKIQLANEEFETMRKSNDQEMTKMAALLKKAEMKIMSLQDAFDRKTRENQELTQLCDDLINKVGTSH